MEEEGGLAPVLNGGGGGWMGGGGGGTSQLTCVRVNSFFRVLRELAERANSLRRTKKRALKSLSLTTAGCQRVCSVSKWIMLS